MVKDMNSKKIYVRYVPSWLTESQFAAFFQQYGEIEHFYLIDPSERVLEDPSKLYKSGCIIYKSSQIIEMLIARRHVRFEGHRM